MLKQSKNPDVSGKHTQGKWGIRRPHGFKNGVLFSVILLSLARQFIWDKSLLPQSRGELNYANKRTR